MQGSHNRPTRWPEPQGKTWFLCALDSRWAERDREAWGKGLLTQGLEEARGFAFHPALPPCSDSPPGWSGATLRSIFILSLHYPVLPWEFGGEGEQKEREKCIIEREAAMKLSSGKLPWNPGAPTSGPAARRLRAPLINSQSVFCPILGFSGP